MQNPTKKMHAKKSDVDLEIWAQFRQRACFQKKFATNYKSNAYFNALSNTILAPLVFFATALCRLCDADPTTHLDVANST
jgi:hypothetical protein